MKRLRRAKIAYGAISLAMLVLGVVLILYPDVSALVVCNIIGCVLAAFGIVKLVGYFSRDLYRLAFQFDLALGVSSLVMGISAGRPTYFHPGFGWQKRAGHHAL